jgi:hypothetical protein
MINPYRAALEREHERKAAWREKNMSRAERKEREENRQGIQICKRKRDERPD